MDVVGKKIESQVQFWSLLGPILLLLATTVLLFKDSVHWYFPLSALVGIPLCVKWKMKGLVMALGCLLLLSGIHYQYLNLEDRYWHVGLAITMAFSFIVLTLSLEEVQGLINQLQLESQSRLNNFALLDGKLKGVEQEWMIEREKFKIEVATLTQEVAKTLDDKQTFYKLAQLSKDELVQVRNQHEHLLQDFLYKKEHIARLQERLEETESTIQGFVNSEGEKQIQSLKKRVLFLEQEKGTLSSQVEICQLEREAKETENTQLKNELEIKNTLINDFQNSQKKLTSENSQQKELIENRSKQIDILEKHQGELKQEMENLFIKVENDSKKIVSPSQNTRKVESMYAQLKEQFHEKCDLLDATRRELFHAQEKLTQWQKEEEEMTIYHRSHTEGHLELNLLQLEQECDSIQKQYEGEIDELTQLVSYLFQKLSFDP